MELNELQAEELNLIQLLRADKKLGEFIKNFLVHYKWKHIHELSTDGLIRSLYGLDEDEDLEIKR